VGVRKGQLAGWHPGRIWVLKRSTRWSIVGRVDPAAIDDVIVGLP